MTFSPSAPGLWTAPLMIASNDEDENPFEISLTGSQATPREAWRPTCFGSPYSTGPGADLNDADGDRLVNLLEFATGSALLVLTLPIGQLVKNGNTLEFTCSRPKAALADVRYDLEVSPTSGIRGRWPERRSRWRRRVGKALAACAGRSRWRRILRSRWRTSMNT